MAFLYVKISGFPDCLGDFGRIQGLFDIADSFQANGSFEIFFIRIAAHKNRNRIRKKLFQPFQHGDSVHARHTYITQNDFGFVKTGLFQTVNTVVSLNDLINAKGFPVNGADQPCTGKLFIVYDQ